VSRTIQKFRPSKDYCSSCGSDLDKVKKKFRYNGKVFCKKECKALWKDAEENPIKKEEEGNEKNL